MAINLDFRNIAHPPSLVKGLQSTFFAVIVFGEYGTSVAKYVTKGRQVLVDGRVQANDKGRFRVIADRVRFGSEPTATKSSE